MYIFFPEGQMAAFILGKDPVTLSSLVKPACMNNNEKKEKLKKEIKRKNWDKTKSESLKKASFFYFCHFCSFLGQMVAFFLGKDPCNTFQSRKIGLNEKNNKKKKEILKKTKKKDEKTKKKKWKRKEEKQKSSYLFVVIRFLFSFLVHLFFHLFIPLFFYPFFPLFPSLFLFVVLFILLLFLSSSNTPQGLVRKIDLNEHVFTDANNNVIDGDILASSIPNQTIFISTSFFVLLFFLFHFLFLFLRLNSLLVFSSVVRAFCIPEHVPFSFFFSSLFLLVRFSSVFYFSSFFLSFDFSFPFLSFSCWNFFFSSFGRRENGQKEILSFFSSGSFCIGFLTFFSSYIFNPTSSTKSRGQVNYSFKRRKEEKKSKRKKKRKAIKREKLASVSHFFSLSSKKLSRKRKRKEKKKKKFFFKFSISFTSFFSFLACCFVFLYQFIVLSLMNYALQSPKTTWKSS